MGLRARATTFAIANFLAAAPLQAALPAAASDSSVHITSHRAALSLDPPSRVYACTDTMVVRYPGGRSDSASLRLHPAYTPLSLRVGGMETGFRFERGRLAWSRPRGADSGDIVLSFRGRIDFPSEYSRVAPERAVLRAEEVLPWGPGVLRSGRLAITLPADWSVIAPGRRSTPEAGSGDASGSASATRTTIFDWDVPIRSVGWICAGRYLPPAVSEAAPGVSLFRLPPGAPDDADAGLAGGGTATGPRDSAQASAILRLCDSLIRFYGSTFEPYRFDRLTVVEVDDWVAGWNVLAVAAPSFVMVKRLAFETPDRFNQVRTILPHEVAHQWWAGSVFPGDRDVALLSEGLSEYSSVLFGEASGAAGPRDTLSKSPLLRPLIAKVKGGTSVPLDTAVDIRTVLTQYLKAAYVHHMLRKEMGDAGYLRLLGEFARRFSGRSAVIDDFRALAEETAGRDLGWFFAQWVAGKGLPSLRLYNVRSSKEADAWRVTGRLRVVGYERYTAGVLLELRTAGEPVRATVTIGLDGAGAYRNDVPFAFTTDSEPSTVTADPDGDLLLLRRLPEKLSDLRDPGDALLIVGGGELASHCRQLAEGDSSRLRRLGWGVAIRSDSTVTLADLQRDRVILYGAAEDHDVIRRLPAPFPMAAPGDSIVIGGEVIRDGTLALVQAAENPWRAEGLLIWVRPFSALARPELGPYDRSWVLLRGRDEVHSGTWPVNDESLVAAVRRAP